MWKRRFAMLLIISAPGLFGACSRITTGELITYEPVDERSGRIGLGTMTESDLESAVRARLNSDPQLRDAGLSVDADVVRNEVTLSGIVEAKAMGHRAIELAAASHPGIVVNDRMEVLQR